MLRWKNKMVARLSHIVVFFYAFIACVVFVNGVIHEESNTLNNVTETEAVTDGFNDVSKTNISGNNLNGPRENTTLGTSVVSNIPTLNATGNETHVNSSSSERVVSPLNENTLFQLPADWVNVCKISGTEIYHSEYTPETTLLAIKCTVSLENFRLIDVRDLNDIPYTSSGVKLSVDIQCKDHESVSISWPIKIRNLYKISVKNCRIQDYYSDFNSKVLDTIPDSLRVIQYENNIVSFPLSMFTEMIQKVDEFPKDYNCGHEDTIEILTMVNQTEDFIVDMLELPDILLASEEYMRDFRRIKHTCDFKHLMVIDESQSESQSTYKMQTLIQHSIFDQLRVYNQSHNYIKSIKEPILHWSVNFPSLEMFDLSWNNISGLYRFEVPVQATSKKLTTINLQHNNISMITLQQLGRLELMPSVFIDIRNNPIDCTCSEDIEQLLDYIHAKLYRNISRIANYSYMEDLQCATPSHLQGITLGALQVTDACPVETSTEYFVLPIIILVVSVVILTVLLILVLRYRQDIQIILFTRFDIILPCKSRVAGRDKQYDAFVSYSSNDEDWIEEFFENLEKKPSSNGSHQFKFCMHHRDFIPGKTIFDNVINSVEASRHTIILLSKHYLGSEFCLYEFQEAFRQSVMEQKRHLIIVMMEDIPETDLPRDLKRCMKTFTYVRKDDSLFVQRLIYALTVKQKTKKVTSCEKEHNSDLATPSLNKRSKQTNSKLSSKLGPGRIKSLVSSTKKKASKSVTNNNSNKNVVQLEDIVEIASSNLKECCAINMAYVNETSGISLNDLGKTTSFKNVSETDNQNIVQGADTKQNIALNSQETSVTNMEFAENSKPLQCENLSWTTDKSLNNTETSCDIKCNSLPDNSTMEESDGTSQEHANFQKSIKRLDSFSKSVMESKLIDSHMGYDRSISCLSQDTGYGSDRGSCNDRNLQEIGEMP